MRIAFITPAFPPQDTNLAVMSAGICSYLAEHGHTIRAFVPDYYFSKIRSTGLISPKVEISPLASLPNPFDKGQFIVASFPTDLPFQVSSFRPDLVYYINPQIHQFPFLALLLMIKRIPLFISYEPPMSRISAFLIGTFSTLARQIIVHTQESANYLEKFGLRKKIVIVTTEVAKLRGNSKHLYWEYERIFNLH